MLDVLMNADPGALAAMLSWIPAVLLVIAGFSVVVFVHELGHFVVAKWAGVRVEKFAVGFGREVVGFTRGETRYSFNILPLGGYVKMLGQEDFAIDKSGEWMVKADPRAFTNKPVGQRMLVISAGVVMNLAFAAFIFMIVFMIGLEQISPVIGPLLPDSPGKRAGLQMGDEILEINGSRVEDFADIKMATVLADPHEMLTMKYRRGNEIGEIQVRPEPGPSDNLLQIGFHPAVTCELAIVYPQALVENKEDLRPGDKLVAVDGVAIKDFTEALFRMIATRGRPVTLQAERTDPADPSAPPKIIEARRRVTLALFPTTADDNNTQHLLGLVPLRKVTRVEEKERGWLAGFRVGDVIVDWGGVAHPTYAEISESILNNPNEDIRVRVRRPGTAGDTELIVTPKYTRKGVFGVGPPSININYDGIDDTNIVVSDTVTSVEGQATPAAGLGLSRGDRIVKLNGQPVSTWYELADLFIAKAGTEIALTYRTQAGTEVTRPMKIPNSVGTLIGLPATGRITSIGNETKVMITGEDGKSKTYSAGHWRGARELLKRHIGQEVEVVYRDHSNLAGGPDVRKVIPVSADMLDPWRLRIYYDDPGLLPMPLTKILRTSNPFHGMFIGVKKTYYFIAQAYLTMKRMVTGSVGIEHISGPVGIVKTGALLVDAGLVKLLYFLAFISANLAVINFLPLPIVDGGLMVFLIIEKIKGKPVSIKTQVVTQIIGLALIIATFVFVTFLDLQKL